MAVYDFLKSVPNPLKINDVSVSSLEELSAALKDIKDGDYAKIKDPLYSWIKNDVGDKRLARQLKELKYVENVSKVIKDRIKFFNDVEQGFDSEEIQVNLNMYINRVKLILDKEKCIRCDVSHTVCPKEAVTVEGSKILVDHEKCVLCGTCVPFCTTGALKIYVDDKEDILVNNYDSLPKLPELETINGEEIKRLFTGNIIINEAKCPEHCEECVSACPINVIHRDGKKTIVDDTLCVLCGACQQICPEDAIQIKRNRILHEKKGFSAVWAEIIEKFLGTEKVNLHENAQSLNKIKTLMESSADSEKYNFNIRKVEK